MLVKPFSLAPRVTHFLRLELTLHKQDSNATSTDILGTVFPLVLRGKKQPHLKIKFKILHTPHTGKQKSMCVCDCACPHLFARTCMHRAILEGNTVALQ